MNNIADLVDSVYSFRNEAEKILGFSEHSVHRLADVSRSYGELDSLTALQADMLRQSLRCIEVGVFRGAHVLAWASLADYMQILAGRDGFVRINLKYPKWNLNSIEDLRDSIGEYQLVEGLNGSGIITKNEKKALHGLLNKRNECAHPTDYYPDLNQALGYVAECIMRLKAMIVKYG
jgi:hypothetical protein